MNNVHACNDTCHKPTIKQRRGYPLCWIFAFCGHQSAGLLDPAVKRLAQLWFASRTPSKAEA